MAVLTSARTAHAQPSPNSDPWWGRDKALHFGGSAGLAATGYAASALFFEDRSARLVSGAGLALTVGIAKELNDLAGHGDPSWRDLTWDFIGTATGLAAAYLVDRFVLSPWWGSGASRSGRTRSSLGARGVGLLVRF